MQFFADAGLDYVSCSQFRVPVARVAPRRPRSGARADMAARTPLRVAVVAEYYPRPSTRRSASGPTGRHGRAGAWVEVRVLALERPLPPLGTLRRGPAALREWLRSARGVPRFAVLDGIPVRYVRFVSPPRPPRAPA